MKSDIFVCVLVVLVCHVSLIHCAAQLVNCSPEYKTSIDWEEMCILIQCIRYDGRLTDEIGCPTSSCPVDVPDDGMVITADGIVTDRASLGKEDKVLFEGASFNGDMSMEFPSCCPEPECSDSDRQP